MQNEPTSASPARDEAMPSVAGVGLTSEALARRRVMLKSLSKGSAVLAAAVPIQSLATGGLTDTRLCTVSGIQSNVGSGRTGGTTDNCRGFEPKHYNTLSNWPGYNVGPPPVASFRMGNLDINTATPFNTVFSGGSGVGLLAVLQTPGHDPLEKTWVAALLNAVKRAMFQPGTAGYFPYTAAEVIGLYTANKAGAEQLFQGYLETLA